MKSVQLTIGEGSLRRSGLVSRRITKSERTSRSNRVSVGKNASSHSMEN
jgi:hypothetical protein